MTWWAWALVGAGAWCVLGMLVGACIDREIREGMARLLLAAVTLPTLFLCSLGMRVPKVSRRVTPDSLADALRSERYDDRTIAINWPRGALVLLRTRPCSRPGCDIRRRHRHESIEVRS